MQNQAFPALGPVFQPVASTEDSPKANTLEWEGEGPREQREFSRDSSPGHAEEAGAHVQTAAITEMQDASALKEFPIH